MIRKYIWMLVLTAVLFIPGCAGGDREDDILRVLHGFPEIRRKVHGRRELHRGKVRLAVRLLQILDFFRKRGPDCYIMTIV